MRRPNCNALQVAIIGCAGIPARYGGFETLAEQLTLGDHLDVHYVVYCSAVDDTSDIYEGNAHRIHINLRANGLSSILYDVISLVISAYRRYDVVLVLGVSGAFFFPIFKLLSKGKLLVNLDGNESKRGKWGRFAKAFLRLNEYLAIKFADQIIIDNVALQRDFQFGKKKPAVIAYGGDQSITIRKDRPSVGDFRYIQVQYGLSISRIEPENNVELILSAAKSLIGKKFIYIGNWSRSDYGITLKKQYSDSDSLILLEAQYDQNFIYDLRSHASFYVHGHSVGGTNPTLVEQMFFDCPIFIFDCAYNIVSTNGICPTFKCYDELIKLMDGCAEFHDRIPFVKKYAEINYKWEAISLKYLDLFRNSVR